MIAIVITQKFYLFPFIGYLQIHFLKLPNLHGFLIKASFKNSVQRQFIITGPRILSYFDSFKIKHSRDFFILSQLVLLLAARAGFAG